jgi:hypothetical protein
MKQYRDRNGFLCEVGKGTPTTIRPEGRVPSQDHPIRECALCGREDEATRHHLTPRANGGVEETAWLCLPCHEFVHHTFTHYELNSKYYTLELLQTSPQVASFVVGRQHHWQPA